MKELQASSFLKFEFQLHETRSEIKEVKENQEKTQVKILRAIQNLTLSVKYERPYLFVPEETYAVKPAKHIRVWTPSYHTGQK